jgi:hypothetical protein
MEHVFSLMKQLMPCVPSRLLLLELSLPKFEVMLPTYKLHRHKFEATADIKSLRKISEQGLPKQGSVEAIFPRLISNIVEYSNLVTVSSRLCI